MYLDLRGQFISTTKFFNKQMQLKKFLVLFFAASLLHLNIAKSANSTWHENQSKGAQTRLIASYYEIDGETKLIAGLHFKMAKGWKIYGNGSDGIGLPPSLDFSTSTNYSKHQIFWPEAINHEEKIGKSSIKYSTYEDEVILPITIDLKEKGKPVELSLSLNYGLCKDICVPASETFSLKITDEIDEKSLQLIQKFFPEKIISTKEVEPAAEKPADHSLSLIAAIFLAIFGGAILNIMPCVLPVLSIKLMSVIEHSGAKISKIRLAFLSTICGILSCFVVFGLLACAIKLTGNSLGWGLQFQDPYFLILLIVIVIFFTGNVLGIFEIKFDQFLATVLNKKISIQEKKSNIFMPNFLSGILAVLLATPCSAPFLGSAISFALVQKFSVIFLIFFCIGLGFALPYIILFAAPKLVYILPKPGMWMLKVKQAMAGLLIATVVWLIYVLSNNIGALPALASGALAVCILLCFKIKSDLLRYLAIITVIISAFSTPVGLQKNKPQKSEYDMVWVNFDEAKIYEHVMNGKVVVIDITADWCLTCKFNKVRVLQDKEVMEELKNSDIVAMRGDITKPDEEIMNFLHKNNRFAIPFNAVFGPNAKTGLLASELLTKKELLALIEQASSPSTTQ